MYMAEQRCVRVPRVHIWIWAMLFTTETDFVHQKVDLGVFEHVENRAIYIESINPNIRRW